MTPQETIAKAAELMRARAEAATPGPYKELGYGEYGPAVGRDGDTGFGFELADSEQGRADAAYFASMPPEVAKATAAFLGSWASWDIGHRDGAMPTPLDFQHAHAIAVAYLRGDQ